MEIERTNNSEYIDCIFIKTCVLTKYIIISIFIFLFSLNALWFLEAKARTFRYLHTIPRNRNIFKKSDDEYLATF